MISARLQAASLAALALSACAYGVGERYFFVPQPAAEIVADPAAMTLVDEQKITGPVDLANRPPILAGRLPATLTKEIAHFGVEGRQTALAYARAANAQPGEPLIVMCGGNASDMIKRGVYYVDKVLPWGELLMWDYPGYGHSNGSPWATSFDDVIGEMAPWIDEQAKDRPLVFWGHSIGGLICSRLASKSREVDAIILETTALSPTRMAKDKTWAIPLLDVKVEGDWNSFDIPQMLKGFSGPVLVTGAGKDETLPVPLAREVGKALKEEGLDVTYVEYAQSGHLNSTLNSDFARDAKVFFARVANTRR